MNFLKGLIGKEKKDINSYEHFWEWFQQNEKTFHKVVKKGDDIDEKFFSKMAPELDNLKDGLLYLTGMCDEETVELVFTVDGVIKNIVFVEELVAAAPEIKGWKFTALKPAMEVESLGIEVSGCHFSGDELSFYPNEFKDFPDEIDITVVHKDMKPGNASTIRNGTFLFLDNLLGELNFVTVIDNIDVIGKKHARQDLIPIEKLKSYLVWRQKEFIEKYDGQRYDAEDDMHSILEGQIENGSALFAVINTDLLHWESKASHPWILNLHIEFDGEEYSGMPSGETFKLLNQIEDRVAAEIPGHEGLLSIGRQTADGVREFYYACKDFRKPSKFLFLLQEEYADRLELSFDFYKDKYWRTFDRFLLI